ncbi:hypothetical protein LAG90_10495 [Marinilongibacter aquaticus]|uniref:cell division protein FtsA n=1 Tax=Marinilongibacter aquaticus TaxID=2975157 RepID=UPI0021BDE67F|nr:cell division FtsA domain-containing protein [Marinilongibacter aquaticus]UBM57250.1 hypothetical protein LAG90_10495 [Marinilongibacter aquaticus]
MKESSEPVYTVGLDIGNSKVCAVAGNLDEEGRICILDYAEARYNPNYESMSKGLVKNKDNTLSAVNAVLEQIAQSSGLNIHGVNCAYSNEQIGMRSVRSEVTNSGNKFTVGVLELDALLKSAKDQLEVDGKSELLHCLPTDFFIDEEKINKMPMGVIGNKLSSNFNGIMSPSRLVDEFLDSTNGMQYGMADAYRRERGNKVFIEQLIYSGHADALSCLSDEDKRAGILLINVGAQLTEVSIYKDLGLRYTRVIGLGAQAIVNDIAQAFNITEEQAEHLLLASGDKLSRDIEINEVLELEGKNGLPRRQFLQKSVALVIESRLKEIAGLAASDVIESGYARMLGNGVMLTGGPVRMHIARKVFEKTFYPLNIRVANATLRIQRNTKLELANPKYSTAIGAMLAGLISLDERIPEIDGIRSKRRPSSMSIFGNNSVMNKIRRMFDDPDLRRSYGE